MRVQSLIIAISLVALVGCGKSDEQKAKDTVETTNTKIEKINSLMGTLDSGGVTLLKYGYGCRITGALSSSEASTVRGHLNSIIQLGGDVLKADSTDGVYLSGRSNIEDIVSSSRECMKKVN